MSNPIRLNLGSGDRPLEGHINIDRTFGTEAYPLQGVDNGAVDEVRASHLLEHFGHEQTADVLADWVRVLKPGGVLKIAVPDFNWIRAHPDDPMAEGYLFGGHLDENDRHGALFTDAKLRALMTEAGLIDIKPWASEIDDCAAMPVSLNLMGTKADPNAPAKPRIKIPKTIAVMSAPRLGFTNNWQSIASNLTAIGIPLGVGSGVFWGASLERLFEKAIADGAEWVLTIDYDTVFGRQDVTDLLRLMHDHPEVDAIAPLQVRRSCDEVLAGIMEDGKPAAGLETSDEPLIKVSTAHFGLTLLRVSSLMKLRHPWFLGVPNEMGRWDDGRQDEDIYFWLKWADAGNNVYVAHRIGVGHLQLMATWPAESGGIIHDFVGNFETSGKPKGARQRWQATPAQ